MYARKVESRAVSAWTESVISNHHQHHHELGQCILTAGCALRRSIFHGFDILTKNAVIGYGPIYVGCQHKIFLCHLFNVKSKLLILFARSKKTKEIKLKSSFWSPFLEGN